MCYVHSLSLRFNFYLAHALFNSLFCQWTDSGSGVVLCFQIEKNAAQRLEANKMRLKGGKGGRVFMLGLLAGMRFDLSLSVGDTLAK